jgi:5-methylcytosine-specific restriction endonuclease McrA
MSDPYKRREYQRNRRLVLEAAGGRCQMVAGCKNPATTADHVIPLYVGGTNDLDNLRAACPAHNSAAGARIATAIRAARKVGPRSRRW